MFDSYTEPDPNAPREGDTEKERFYPKNLVGHSVMLWVNDHIQEVPGAANQDAPDGLDVSVVDLGPYGDPNAQWGWVGVHVIWQANSLIGKLKNRVGNPNPIVIYVGKGTPAQKGWQAPFVLTDVSQDPQVRGKAEAWMNQNPAFAPNPPRQQPSSQPAGQPQGQHYPQPAPVSSGPAPAPHGPAPQGYPAPAPQGQWGAPQGAAPAGMVGQSGPIRSTPPYPESYPMPAGSQAAPSSGPPQGGSHGYPDSSYPAPAPNGGQQGWTGSPEQTSSPYGQPSLSEGDPNIGVERLARAHEPGRNATLDSLRQRHGIPQPQQDNPPF